MCIHAQLEPCRVVLLGDATLRCQKLVEDKASGGGRCAEEAPSGHEHGAARHREEDLLHGEQTGHREECGSGRRAKEEHREKRGSIRRSAKRHRSGGRHLAPGRVGAPQERRGSGACPTIGS